MADLKTKRAEEEKWWKIISAFFKDCFRFWQRQGKGLLSALELALTDTKRLKAYPFKPKGEPIDMDILYAFCDMQNAVIREIKSGYIKGKTEDDIRVCDNCGLPMLTGYYLGGEFACDDECCLALYNGDKAQMEEDLSHACEDSGECYYTEWDSIFFD